LVAKNFVDGRDGKAGQVAQTGLRPAGKNAGWAHLFNLLTRINSPRITRGPCGPAAGRAGLQARKPKKKQKTN